jgi:hypothetical protein
VCSSFISGSHRLAAIRSVDDAVQRILNEMGEYIVAELLCGNAPECSRSVR